ncbi:MAG: DHH family phosphoesterase [Nanoarchaeota archaeon]|nr:DHH family phosphoesterase [Nanoarchaeota archaeon]MBU0977245.1 DHH family phosphoesterase [Nanoarchaeota archaeon]
MNVKNNSFEEIWNRIKTSRDVLISLHYGPDGDSLGCCTAMKYVLKRDFKCNVKLVGKDNLDEILRAVRFSKEVVLGEGIEDQELEKFDLMLAMDSGSLKQFAGREKDFVAPKNLLIINIDHHETNEHFGGMNYVDAKRPSACSVLLDLFRDRGVNFDKELATRLLLGIYTDSGYFSHDNGGSIRDAAFLLDFGVDYLNEIVNPIKYNYPLRIKKYYAFLYDRFKIIEVNGLRVGHSSISLEEIKKLGLNLSEVRGGINDLQEVGGLDIVFTLSEMEEIIKGSFRSRKLDISGIAKVLGGGGHKGAAAFRLKKMPLEEAERVVLDKISSTFRS